MKFLFDLFPVGLFFGAIWWGGKFPDAAHSVATQYLSGLVSGGTVTASLAPTLIATAVAIIGTILQVGYLLIRGKKVHALLWVSLAVISVFGGATIYFQNATFILWKPTILYWFTAGAFLVSQLILKKNLIRVAMGEQISMPDPIWDRLSLAWVTFFLLLGVLNLYVAFNFPIAIWATFKFFGVMGLIFVFVIGQTVFLSKYIKEPQ